MKTKLLTNIFIFTFLFSALAQAKTEAELLKEIQVGEEWGKVVARQVLPNIHPSLARSARGVAEFKRGSAFIVQTKDSSRVIFATNAHVIVDEDDALAGDLSSYRSNAELACHNQDLMKEPVESVRLGLLGITGHCKRVLGIWPDIDFALFEAEFEGVDIENLNQYAIHFSTSLTIEFGKDLAMFGFGHFMNPGNPDLELMFIRDLNCRVFSSTNDFRFITDPDEFNPNKYKVWSFVLGCDVSWGDSGSPILDLNSGQLVGIIFTGKYPKNQSISLNPQVMERLRSSPQEIAWSNLNFGVPLVKILEVMRSQPWPNSKDIRF